MSSLATVITDVFLGLSHKTGPNGPWQLNEVEIGSTEFDGQRIAFVDSTAGDGRPATFLVVQTEHLDVAKHTMH